MLTEDRGAGETVEDALRALGLALDEARAQGVVLVEVPDGLVVRARVMPTLRDRIDGAAVDQEWVYGAKEILERRLESLARRGTGHRAGPLERSLRVLGRYIDRHELREVTIMEHDDARGWLLWHRSTVAGGPVLVTFDHDEVERVASSAEAERGGLPVPVEMPMMELPAYLRR
jgi:hypothetical protein